MSASLWSSLTDGRMHECMDGSTDLFIQARSYGVTVNRTGTVQFLMKNNSEEHYVWHGVGGQGEGGGGCGIKITYLSNNRTVVPPRTLCKPHYGAAQREKVFQQAM